MPIFQYVCVSLPVPRLSSAPSAAAAAASSSSHLHGAHRQHCPYTNKWHRQHSVTTVRTPSLLPEKTTTAAARIVSAATASHSSAIQAAISFILAIVCAFHRFYLSFCLAKQWDALRIRVLLRLILIIRLPAHTHQHTHTYTSIQIWEAHIQCVNHSCWACFCCAFRAARAA